ncbi:cell adhesion molecule 4-like [Antedon mediterranea]|uniref:cell adhesion molecule 4-like n=1 Tax=Antedon mediterranea TaxID=105859 RepID=UPI003AF54496
MYFVIVFMYIVIILGNTDGQQFLSGINDISVLEGESVTVKCFIQGTLPESSAISWWKGDRQLSNKNNILIEDSRITATLTDFPGTNKITYLLVISPSVREDEGKYYCRIISDNNEIRSEIIQVTILRKPSDEYPQCIKSKESYIAGSDVKLSCISELINPPVDLSWTRTKTSISDQDVSTDILDDIVYKHLQFTAKNTDNDETFVCLQISEVVPATSNCTIANLNIQYIPEVKIRHTSVIFAGSDSILFCQTAANPPVRKFSWTFQPVLKSYEYATEGQVLRLLKPTISRNGTQITCKAENTIGSTIATTTVYILKEIYVKSKDSNNKIDSNVENNGRVEVDINTENNADNEDKVSLYVVIIIIILVVIIVVVVVIIPVYYQCFCKTRTATDSSGRELYQPTVYYDTRDRVSNSGLYDRSLPRLPSTGHYGHWRHSFASQVPEDLDVQGYTYIDNKNNQNQNTL